MRTEFLENVIMFLSWIEMRLSVIFVAEWEEHKLINCVRKQNVYQNKRTRSDNYSAKHSQDMRINACTSSCKNVCYFVHFQTKFECVERLQ
jgi:hypothetical protein